MPLFVALGLFLCALVLLPLGWLGWYSVSDKSGAVTLGNFARLASDPSFSAPFLTSLGVATASSVAAALVATVLAWLVARTDMPGRRVIRALVTASFVTPPFLGAIAWEILAAPNSGMLNQWYRALTGAEQYEYLFNIYSVEGVIFAIACYAFPYVFVLVANGLDRIPAEFEEAAAILGARRWLALRRITLPLVLPAILAGGTIAFLQALTVFGTPAILALPAGFHVITTKIWSLFQYPPNPYLAAAAALPLLLVTLLLLRIQAWLLGRRTYTLIGGKSGAPRLVPLGWGRWIACGFALFVLALPVALPYAALLRTALVRTITDPLSLETITLHNLRFVFFEFSQTWPALWNTLFMGVASATCGTVLAVIVAYIAVRRLIRGHRTLAFLATAPVAIPGIVLGVGLFLAYTRPPLVLYGTLWILLLAFLTIELPIAYQQLQAAVGNLHPELEDAARILGAGQITALWRIVAPLLATSVVATWCFIFIGVIRELSATIMLTTAKTKVVAVIIYDLNESGDLGAISVLGLTLLVVTFAVVLLANRLPALGRSPL
jgi:iron(III) transport system permease protein